MRGTCPNPKCNYDSAYSDECDRCGHQHEPTALINPKSVLSNATPEQRDTVHWFLDMWKVSEVLRAWIEGKAKKKAWRPSVIADTLEKVLPSLRFDGEHEDAYKALKATLPAHKSKYAPGKKVVVQFGDKATFEKARAVLAADWRLGSRKASTHAIQQRMSSIQAMYSSMDSRIIRISGAAQGFPHHAHREP